MIPAPVRLVLVAVAAVLAFAGCAPATDGPLTFGTSEDTICGPVELYAHPALGTELRSDEPDAVIVITRVEPINPDGLDYIGASVMPLDPEGGGFMFSAYPPTEQFPDQWPLAEEAIGASFTSDTRAAIVTEFEYTATGTASVEGLLVHYTVGETEYTARTHLSMVISDQDCDEVAG